jgi:hypothetical protein
MLYICELNNCGYTSEYSNKQSNQIRSPQLFTVPETLTSDNNILNTMMLVWPSHKKVHIFIQIWERI